MKRRRGTGRKLDAVLSHREIAAKLGVCHGTVINIERAALAKLRRVLEGRGDGG